MHGYLSLDIICSLKLTVFLELRSRKTVHFSEKIMSADKYPCIFSRQMETIVYIITKREVIIILATVVRKMDNSIQRINRYPLDNVVCFANTYPLESDLSSGYISIQPSNNLGLMHKFSKWTARDFL